MTLQITCEQSNKADWTLQISATDSDTSDPIDFTDATISFALKDENGCQRLSASTSDGKITSPSTGVVQIAFTDTEMKCLPPAIYQIGAVCLLDGATFQLLTGSITIYDGVANL